MAGPLVELRSATPQEMPQAAASIVFAFVTDPFMRFACPAPHTYLRAMHLYVREVGMGSIEHGTAYVSADFCAAALWFPPGTHPNYEAIERITHEVTEPERLEDVLATHEKMSQSHPDEPHWFLPVIGVDPHAQGKGLGGALMRHAVARCDEQGTLAYLESTNPRNISLYERHGFEAIGEIQEGAAPLVTPMLRRPR